MAIILRSAVYRVIMYFDGAFPESGFMLPNIFVIDKQLTGMDGLVICQHLKRGESTRHIPIIMVSANPNIHQLAREAGADGALEKPFKIKELRDIVAKHLGLGL